MQDYKKLLVWQKAHQLTIAVYRATHSFPSTEQYGITSQSRRAAASVPANIAEGCGRGSNADLARFLHIAMGSAFELEYHLLLAHDLHLLDDGLYQQLEMQVIEVKRMLTALIQRISN